MTARAVTFDAYNTLFDFSTDALPTLRAMMPESAHPRLDEIWETMNRVVIGIFRDFVEKRREHFPAFVTLADIHRACFAEVQARFLPGLDVGAATDAWNRYISQVPLYEDALPALRWASERFPTGIVSDIDTWMLEENPALPSLPLVGYVTSEQDGSYKAMADCTMFRRAARMLRCKPENIVHVGDSHADVLAAKRAGARAIWLNRNGDAPPSAMPKPDAVIRALTDLPSVMAQYL